MKILAILDILEGLLMTIQASTIQKWLLKQGITEPAQVIHLLGDGSSRQFFRVRIAAKGAHYILLSDPSWTLTQDYPAHQQALKSARLPVPAFIAIDPSAGFLLMEDLCKVLCNFRSV
ncbi:MAG: hypothetical protein EB078_03055 [Proteobacteria bacterium]|nr:hypothetical protein [Pseudomonadota bacterium]